ncbi:uncharacterized protein LOC131075238 [Cryptomeria japonica]|uniref:uncharacterized protein LOC131075238 n=1 Tax=Cryptomeria japonica TaxID=3369 RepID=UPI0027D9FB88|nr:uncharacterized protein LOC131075238 [Cryptomeria japonica]
MGNSNDSAKTDLLGLRIEELKEIPSCIPLRKLNPRKLHYLSVWGVKELWSSFHQQLQTNIQASFELRKLSIEYCPSQKIPDLIGMFSHLEELTIFESLENTDITSLSESIKRLSNLRSLHLETNTDGKFESESEIESQFESENLDVFSLEASTGSCATSLETIEFKGLDNMSKLVISGEICPRLRSLSVEWMSNLEEMDLKHLERLNTLHMEGCDELETMSRLSSLTGLQSLEVEHCPNLETISGLSSLTGLRELNVSYCRGLKSLPTLARQRHLQKFTVKKCYQLQSVEGFEEWHGLESLIIEVSRKGWAWVQNCIYGLKRLPSHQTILIGKAVDATSSRLDVNLFSEVTGIQALVEIETGEYISLYMSSSSNAITIYAFLGSIEIYDGVERMITVLLPHHNSEGISIYNINIKKGFKAIVNKGEEEKALILMKRIVNQLYV